jgi:hypothetical protein
MTRRDEHDELTEAAHDSVEVSEDGAQAGVSIPGTSGHHEPGERAEVTKEALSDERLDEAENVAVAVPLGDTEALDEARRQLNTESTRAAGATVIVEGSKRREE